MPTKPILLKEKSLIAKLVDRQHSLPMSIVLHLLPGIPITLFYILTAPIFVRLGFPPAFALCLAIPLILIPAELGLLYFLGKKINNKPTLKGIVLYQEKLKTWHFIGYVFLVLVCSVLAFALLQKPLASFIVNKLFFWAPTWYLQSNSFTGPKLYLLITWLMLMVFANVIGPIVEEYYFRGYLLPRISRYKGWAPVLNAVLFSAYHFWTPWEIVTRIVAVTPLSFIAYKKENIYIGITSHLLLNTLSTIPLLALILK